MEEFDFAFILGALFVGISAYDRFSTPPSNRASTTAARYYVSAVLYVAIAFISFLLLSRYPNVLGALLSAMGAEDMASSLEKLPPALLTALVLTVLLEKLPYFATADNWLRRKLQYMASIPHEARRLSRHLQRRTFTVGPALQQSIARKLLSQGFQQKDIQFSESDNAQFLWIKSAALMEQIEVWETESRYIGFLSTFADELKSLKRQYEQVRQKALLTFRMDSDLSPDPEDAKTQELVTAYRSDFRDSAEALLTAICDFVSRGTLQCTLSGSARVETLRALGFVDVEEWADSKFTFHQLTTIFIMLCCVLLFGMVIASHTARSFEEILVKVVMIATIYCVAIGCALFLKDRWEFAQRRPGGLRPTASYVLAGALAAVLGIGVSLLFKWILFHFDTAKTLEDVSKSYPWTLLTFTTAAMTACQTDNGRTRLGRWQPLLEACLQSAVMVAAAYVTYLWLRSTGYAFAQRPEFLWRILPLTAAIGFCIGLLVPSWYRGALHVLADDGSPATERGRPNRATGQLDPGVAG